MSKPESLYVEPVNDIISVNSSLDFKAKKNYNKSFNKT